MYDIVNAGSFLSAFAKENLKTPFEYGLGCVVWFNDSILNKGILCKVKHGNEWSDIPVLISGVFICRNDFSYYARVDDIPADFSALKGSNHFSDAIPISHE